ncbi:MAG: NTP transferase domain-containing protein [Candidatus Eisenbacteria sp.]|nr:NTP transferase domain-containing protein [Candidatus Eisenbacteria bacterium]
MRSNALTKKPRSMPVAIVPAAGVGTRLRPQTHTVPKALVNVAGKPILGHILDALLDQGITSIKVVVGYMGERIEEYIRERYRKNIDVIEQSERLGLGHAIAVTAPHVPAGPVLIVLGDTIVEPEWSDYLSGDEAVIGVKEVEDPRRFGVVEVRGDTALRLVEKPSEPLSNLAIVGLYYFPDSVALFKSLRTLVKGGSKTKGEFQLTDALQSMLENGMRMRVSTVEGWFDCGKPETLLETNQHLLRKVPQPTPIPGVTLVPPVFVAPTARIEKSILGPNVSVADGAVIRRTIVRDSIVNEHALVEDMLLERSVVGESAVVRGVFQRLNVGESSAVDLSGGSF